MQSRPVGLHLLVFTKPSQNLSQYPRCPRIFLRRQPVVHPFAVASCRHNSSLSKIRQMAGNLGLRLAENFH